MPDLPTLSIAAVIGFVVGVIINLLANYLPDRRLYMEASRSPFASPSSIPPRPYLIPRAPIYAWSAVIARLSGHHAWIDSAYAGTRWPRRIAVELGTALIFAWVTTAYSSFDQRLFFWVCTPFLMLIAIIDIEHRWVMTITWLPLGLFAFAYELIWPRIPPETMIRGILTLFAIGLFFYLLGILIQRSRRVGRTVFGLGDVWLMALSGLLVGWPNAGLALLITVFAAGLASIGAIFENRASRRRRRALAIPYAPYLMLGTALLLYTPWLLASAMLTWIRLLPHR